MTQPEKAYAAMLDCNEQRDQLILDELPQVYYIARRIHERLPQHIPLDDLVHAGVLGLIEALQNFDSAKKVQVKTFAKFRIRGAILDSLRDMDWGSRPLRRKGRKIEEAIAALEMRLGRQPNEQEIADELQVDVKELWKTLALLDGLNLVGQESDSFSDRSEVRDLIESAPSNPDESPFALCAQAENKRLLAEAIGKLSEKEQLVVSLYYKEELTMKEVAAVLKIAESRVSQIHSLALAKLRVTLGKMQPQP